MSFVGLLAGAFDGAARATGEVADSAIKAQDDKRKELASNAEYDRRLQVAMDKKLAQEQIVSKQNALTRESAESTADKVGSDRRFAKFQQDLGQTDLPLEEQRRLFDEFYNNKVTKQGEDGQRYVERDSVRSKDVLNAVVKGGGSGEAITEARKDMTAQIAAERAADAATLAARREDRKDALADAQAERDRQRLEQGERKLDILASRNNGGGGRADNPEKLEIQKARERRLDIKDQIATTIKKRENGLLSKDEAKTRLAELEAQQIRYDKIIKDSDEPEKPAVKREAGQSKPAQDKATNKTLSSLPPGAKQVGTSGGKPVYQTPDGKKFIED